MKYALKSVPGIADVRDSHGGSPRMVSELQPDCPDKKKYTHHVDQHEKLKGLGA